MSERRDELIDGWLTGTLDEEGLDELAGLTAADARVADRALAVLRIHRLLPLALRSRDGAPERAVIGEILGRRTSDRAPRTQSRPRLRSSARLRRVAPTRTWAPRSALFAAVAAAAAVMALALLNGHGSADGDRAPRPVAAAPAESGEPTGAELTRGGGEWAPVPAGGMQVQATRDGFAIRWRDGTHVDLLGGTTASVLGTASAKRLRLDAGVLVADVAHQAGAPLTVETTHGTAEVLGTRLRMTASPSTSVLLVDQGAVRFRDRTAVEVAAGRYAVGGGAAEGARSQGDLLRDASIPMPWMASPVTRAPRLSVADGDGTTLELGWDGTPGQAPTDGGYGQIACPYRWQAGDRAFEVELRVDAAIGLERVGQPRLPPTLEVALLEDDGDCWRVGEHALVAGSAAWDQVRVALPAAANAELIRQYARGDGVLDRAHLSHVLVSVQGATVRVALRHARVAP